MKSIRYIMYFVLISMTMSLLAQENAQAVAQGENKIDEKVERNTIRKGNGLFNDKKYTEAEIEYRKALEANPSSEIATYNLGAALYKQQKWNDSRNEYRKIVQASSDSLRAAHAWHNLGNISFQEKNYAQSIEEYKNALRRNPKDDETRYNLRLAQLLLKQQQEQQNQDKNDDKDQQDKNKDQQKDQKQDQQEQNNNQNNQDKNKDQQEQNKPQQQQPQQSQMSKENAQQILDAIQQDERDTQEKVQKALMQQQKRKKTDKEW
ncbi:tetratricopeptide repeat protein [Barnesiella intestinihominis]|uniref:tetratricopeptide repeat protein n=1 Tax=Barnesiella intestinihominis TaxID=487174 RepID=UPI003970DBB5